jgi:release factor glutamine methyltransferase
MLVEPPTQYASLLGEIQAFFQPLPDKPEETPESVLRALWFSAAGRPMSIGRINGQPLPALDGAALGRLQGLIALKRAGVPLAHLTGRQSFLGLELLAGPEALIPRVETEILAKAAIARLAGRHDPVAIDVCTGCGNLALAYAREGARVYAADLSEDAIALAKRNADFTGLADRVTFFAGDLFQPLEALGLEGACDLVSCNPPYITSAKVGRMPEEISAHEPKLAFDGGAMGLSIITRVFAEAPRYLRPGGALALEIGLGQGPLLHKRLSRLPWVADTQAHRDGEGHIRALLAVRR